MERETKKTAFFLIFLLFVLFSVNAQNTNKQESLTYVLNHLQDQYVMQFNYAEDSVENIFLIPPSKTLSFSEVLIYLERKTGLSFLMMSDSIVLVKPKNDLVLCGYLKDSDNFEPIVSGTIQTENNSIISDENGFFEIKIENTKQPISIRFLGYKTLIKSFNEFSESGCQDVFLTPSFQPLSEIIISN